MLNIHPAPDRPASFGARISQGIGRGLDAANQLQQQGQQREAIRNTLGKGFENLPPEYQKMAYEYALKSNFEKQKQEAELQGNDAQLRDLEQRRELEPGSLNAYRNDPKAAEQVTRPAKETKPALTEKEVPPEISRKIKKIVADNPEASADDLRIQMDEAGIPPVYSNPYTENRRRTEETKQKAFESAYKANENFINDATTSYKAFETETKPRLLQMRNIKDEDVIGPTSAVFLETLGIPLGVLEDPSSELYQKLSQDLLKGLPETYGSRILKVEVDNFLKTIPTLLNSADGRRMIASNMLKLGEMKEVYYNEMRKQQSEALDKNKFPRDFQQKVFDQVKPQIDRINNDFVKLSEVKSVPEGTIPFFSPNGDIEFVPKEHAQWAQENGGRRIW